MTRASSSSRTFVGDIGFGENYMHLARAKPLQSLLSSADGYRHTVSGVRELLDGADTLIGNLEVPLAPHPNPALRGRKKYLSWCNPDRTVNMLQELGFSALSLANNHALDAGTDGLAQSVSRLQAGAIAPFGGGPDLAHAGRPYVQFFELGGVKRSLVVFGLFEQRARYVNRYRWYADRSTPGVAALDPLRIQRSVEWLRQRLPNPVFVAYPHWGQDYQAVDPSQRDSADALLAAGVDTIIGHGTHALQGVERIDGRSVVYGLGNFVWNSPGRYEKLAALPYSAVCQLIMRPSSRGLSLETRLLPFVSDNRRTQYQSRPVTQSELNEIAIATRSSGHGLVAGRDSAGRAYLALPQERQASSKLNTLAKTVG